jgi:membrane protein
MSSLKDRLARTVTRLRERHPVVDHAVRMQRHYGKVGASQQAGAVTYFAFLSFFPILALSFFVVGWVAKVYPRAKDDLVKAIDSLLPGLVGTGDGQISVVAIQDAAGAVGLIGLAGVLYAGLGWLSAMRDALEVVFEEPREVQPGFVAGKVRDLLSLVTVGVVLLLSVAVAGFVTGFSDLVLGWVGLDSQLDWLVNLIARVIGFGANVLLFFSLFKLLTKPKAPNRSLWHGALLGAIVFEALKAGSFLLLASTKDQPAFQAFGIALILLVWINYFSRVVLYAAAWAHTSRSARAIRDQEAFEKASMQELTRVELHEAPAYAPEPAETRKSAAGAFAAGGAATLALLAVLKKKDT